MDLTMKRYLQTLLLCWQVAIALQLEYRIDFILALISSVGSLIGSWFGLFLFYQRGYTFAGWRWEETLAILGIFTLLQGFANTLLVPNLSRIVEQVQQGSLDFVLLRPMNSQFWLSTHRISPWGIPDLLLGLGLIGYAGSHLGLPWWGYGAGAIAFLFACLSLYSIWFMLGVTSIWFIKIYNVTEVLRSLLEAGRYPLSAYPMAYRVFFTFVIPVAFLTNVPAEMLMGRGSLIWLIGAGGLSIVLLFISHQFWRFALRYYTSASS